MFERLAPFLQDYIYNNGWEELRPIQVGACDVIFNTNNNLLISSGTASGKTEAAFFPILTDIYENSDFSSIDILYISPLKALINDQYERLEELLKDIDIPICKWHGDVSTTKKQFLIKNPKGILQITPESLEALLMRKTKESKIMFSNLKYIVIDEIHYFLNEVRGLQLKCLLERLQSLIEITPRRIALSATIGDLEIVSKWLSEGTNVDTQIISDNSNKRIKLLVDYFKYDENDEDHIKFYNKLYERTCSCKNLIFSNSRTEVEENLFKLNRISQEYKNKTNYFGHHSSISASVKNEIENNMKNSDTPMSVCSTTTLELGIDIGKLDQVVQTGSVLSVSSFLQRLGRTGRRENIPQMLFMVKERNNSDFWNQNLNSELLLAISIIELYRKEKWIETPIVPKKPFEILLHQTLSILYSEQPLSVTELSEKVLSLSTFKNITKAEYKILLKHLKENEYIMFDEDKKLILDKNGEKLTNHFDFFAVFSTIPEYIVSTQLGVIGSVSEPHKKGTVFLLQGKQWKVIELNQKNKTIYVKEAQTSAKNKWTSLGSIEFHDKIIKNIKTILASNEIYPYLTEQARVKLEEMRKFYNENILTLDSTTYIPWLGTNKINSIAVVLDNANIDYEIIEIGYIKLGFKFYKDINLKEIFKQFNFSETLMINEELLNFEIKYQEIIPKELLKIKYWNDFFQIIKEQ